MSLFIESLSLYNLFDFFGHFAAQVTGEYGGWGGNKGTFMLVQLKLDNWSTKFLYHILKWLLQVKCHMYFDLKY